jgi:predicted lipoprotein with Yx(FWY)xxD motif
MNQSQTVLKAAGLLSVAAVGLAACGGGNSKADAASSGKAPAIAVNKISGQRVLALRGHSLYTPSQEKNGTITCTGGCTAIWAPVKASAGKNSKVGRLSSLTRPGGRKQLTYRGRPLYTFTQEGKGKLTGDGIKDRFGGHNFTWHVVKTKGSPSSKPAPQGGGGNGYGY